jgi:hypothetical protein
MQTIARATAVLLLVPGPELGAGRVVAGYAPSARLIRTICPA